MKQSVGLWGLMGFAVTSLSGTILHFLYEWLENAIWVAPLSGVNESTWEHMKLLFWPMLLFAVVQSIFFKNRKDFWCIKLKGILLGISLIPILFYTYNGVIGHSPDWVNITIFFMSAALAYAYETKQLKQKTSACLSSKVSILIISIFAALFVIFTFKTPELGIFKDPISGTYGI